MRRKTMIVDLYQWSPLSSRTVNSPTWDLGLTSWDLGRNDEWPKRWNLFDELEKYSIKEVDTTHPLFSDGVFNYISNLINFV